MTAQIAALIEDPPQWLTREGAIRPLWKAATNAKTLRDQDAVVPLRPEFKKCRVLSGEVTPSEVSEELGAYTVVQLVKRGIDIRLGTTLESCDDGVAYRCLRRGHEHVGGRPSKLKIRRPLGGADLPLSGSPRVVGRPRLVWVTISRFEHRINKGMTGDAAQPVVVGCRSLGA